MKPNSAELEFFKRTMHKLSRKLSTLIVQFYLLVVIYYSIHTIYNIESAIDCKIIIILFHALLFI